MVCTPGAQIFLILDNSATFQNFLRPRTVLWFEPLEPENLMLLDSSATLQNFTGMKYFIKVFSRNEHQKIVQTTISYN